MMYVCTFAKRTAGVSSPISRIVYLLYIYLICRRKINQRTRVKSTSMHNACI